MACSTLFKTSFGEQKLTENLPTLFLNISFFSFGGGGGGGRTGVEETALYKENLLGEIDVFCLLICFGRVSQTLVLYLSGILFISMTGDIIHSYPNCQP